MPNAIKYNTSAQTLALKKGNFWIGTGDVGKGPTSSTDYYNGISPPSGGYTIYLNKASNGPSIYTVSNDSGLVTLTNQIAGASYTTAAQCLVYFASQTDKMVFNRDYESIITNGLYYTLDPGFTPSYPKSGTTLYDITASYNGTLVNGLSYVTTDGGTLSFDGTDDYILMPNAAGLNTTFTLTIFAKLDLGDYPASNWALPLYSKGQDGAYGGWGVASTVNGSGVWWSDIVVEGVGQFNAHGYTNYTRNTWEMWTTVCDTTNGTLKTYQGSALVGNNTSITPGPLRGNQAVFLGANGIGANGGLPGSFMKGNMGTVLMYNRALSLTEITQNYNTLKGRFGL